MIKIKANPIIVPKTLESDHGYIIPPHCRANNRDVIPPISSVAPMMSIWRIFCICDSSVFAGGGGFLIVSQN